MIGKFGELSIGWGLVMGKDGVMSYRGETIDINSMGIEGLRKVINILMELMSHEHDRVTALQDRVLALEKEAIK